MRGEGAEDGGGCGGLCALAERPQQAWAAAGRWARGAGRTGPGLQVGRARGPQGGAWRVRRPGSRGAGTRSRSRPRPGTWAGARTLGELATPARAASQCPDGKTGTLVG